MRGYVAMCPRHRCAGRRFGLLTSAMAPRLRATCLQESRTGATEGKGRSEEAERSVRRPHQAVSKRRVRHTGLAGSATALRSAAKEKMPITRTPTRYWRVCVMRTPAITSAATCSTPTSCAVWTERCFRRWGCRDGKPVGPFLAIHFGPCGAGSVGDDSQEDEERSGGPRR